MLMIADVAAAPVQSVGSQILGMLLSPASISVVIAGAFGLLAMILNGVVRRRRVALAVYHAFRIVEDIANEEGKDNSALDKVASGLKAADEWMVANGWRPLKPGEQEVAKLGFKAMNGESKMASP